MDSIVNITEDYNEYVLLEEVNFMTISGTARQTKITRRFRRQFRCHEFKQWADFYEYM